MDELLPTDVVDVPVLPTADDAEVATTSVVPLTSSVALTPTVSLGVTGLVAADELTPDDEEVPVVGAAPPAGKLVGDVAPTVDREVSLLFDTKTRIATAETRPTEVVMIASFSLRRRPTPK